MAAREGRPVVGNRGSSTRLGAVALSLVVLIAGCGGPDDTNLASELEDANRRIEELENAMSTTSTSSVSTSTTSTTTILATTSTTVTTAAPQVTEPPYVAPDPATVRQFVRSVFAERLERAPDDSELEHSVNWYLAEDRKGGDTRSRFLEWFEQAYAGEIGVVERRREQQQCEEDYLARNGAAPPAYMC